MRTAAKRSFEFTLMQATGAEWTENRVDDEACWFSDDKPNAIAIRDSCTIRKALVARHAGNDADRPCALRYPALRNHRCSGSEARRVAVIGCPTLSIVK
jgi:hypothetical protein